jgi:hypothetical protein
MAARAAAVIAARRLMAAYLVWALMASSSTAGGILESIARFPTDTRA